MKKENSCPILLLKQSHGVALLQAKNDRISVEPSIHVFWCGRIARNNTANVTSQIKAECQFLFFFHVSNAFILQQSL